MHNKSIKLTSLIIASLIIIVNIILFTPVLIFRNSQEVELKQTVNLEYLEIVNYNPFKPKLRQYIKLDDPAYWVLDQEYERTGLFSFAIADTEFKSFEEMGINRVEASNLEEAKNKFKQNKIGLDTEEKKLLQEYEKEQEKPNECQQLIEIQDKVQLKDIYNVKVGDDIRKGFLGETDGVISRDSNKKYFLGLKLEQGSVIKVNFYLGNENPSLNPEPKNLNVSSIALVTQDCQIITVPTKPDGTFDFDGALEALN